MCVSELERSEQFFEGRDFDGATYVGSLGEPVDTQTADEHESFARSGAWRHPAGTMIESWRFADEPSGIRVKQTVLNGEACLHGGIRIDWQRSDEHP